jgi:DNA-binding CsgD family transcriptional regulator
MATVVTLSDQDLCALAELVSQDREPDVPAVGLPPSLLRDLMARMSCDRLDVLGLDSIRQELWFSQMVTDDSLDEDQGEETPDEWWWALHFDSLSCSYPERTGDLRGIVKNADFYSRRQWHSVGMYREVLRPQGLEHELQLCLPGPPGPDAGPGRTVRLFFLREPGPDFSERDRALLTLLRPHLQQAYLDAERRRSPVPELTPRQWELLKLIAVGHTNTQIARQLVLSEGTVRTHLENIYGRLGVSNRTAAVIKAFPERVA